MFFPFLSCNFVTFLLLNSNLPKGNHFIELLLLQENLEETEAELKATQEKEENFEKRFVVRKTVLLFSS